MNEEITHRDVLEIIEALREQGKRLKRLAASRSYIGPANAVYRQGLRKRARRAEELACVVIAQRAGDLAGPAMSPRRPRPGLPLAEDSDPARPGSAGGKVMIEITGSHEHGQNITGWQDGRTQARVWWKGTDDDPRSPGAHWVEYLAVTTGERQTLGLVGMIKGYVNLELISAELEPLGAVRACPRCDHVLETRNGLPRCPRCGRPVLRDELEQAARVNRVVEGAMDVIDQAVTDGRLPG